MRLRSMPRNIPHKMGAWTPDSKTHVSHMTAGDFYHSEKSVTMEKAGNVKIEFVDQAGNVKVLKEKLPLQAGEVLDGAFMSAKALRKFIAEQIEDAKAKGVLFSVHLKATMMKISDPIMFGHFVSVFYKDVFEKHAATFKELGVNPDLGMGDLYAKIAETAGSQAGRNRSRHSGSLQKTASTGHG